MASSEISVSFVALVISIVALAVTAAQLLQAIFGTANGYRKCQPSVMGEWARFTHLKWRWSLFGFETRYITPHFYLFDGDRQGDYEHPTFRLLSYLPHQMQRQLGTNPTIGELFPATPPATRGARIVFVLKLVLQDIFATLAKEGRTVAYDHTHATDAGEKGLLTWKALTAAICSCQDRQMPATPHGLPRLDLVNIDLVIRSWDFMPLDVVTPLASTTLRSLIAIGHRLGMRWIRLDILRGELLAQGASGTLTSRMIRGLGLTVEFNLDTSYRSEDRSEQLIPDTRVDHLAMGMIQSVGTKDADLSLVDRMVEIGGHMRLRSYALETDLRWSYGFSPYTCKDITWYLENLDIDGSRPDNWTKQRPGARPAIDELIALTVGTLSPQEPLGLCILHPLRFDAFLSPLATQEGQSALITRLRLIVAANVHRAANELRPVLSIFEDLARSGPVNANHDARPYSDRQVWMEKLDYYNTCVSNYFMHNFSKRISGGSSNTFCGTEHILRDSVDRHAVQIAPEDLTASLERRKLVIGAHFNGVSNVQQQQRFATKEGFRPLSLGPDDDTGSFRNRDVDLNMLELGHHYVNCSEDIANEIRSRYREHSSIYSRADVEQETQIRPLVDWWVLMLQGMIWFMGVKIRSDCSQFPIVPSSFTGEGRTVYLI